MILKEQLRKVLTATTVLCCLLILPAIASAGNLTGTITDKSSGAGLFNALVTLWPEDESLEPFGQAADESGNFDIGSIPPGEYSVTVSYIGFVTFRSSEITIDETGVVNLSAALVPSAINIGATTVTASRRPEKILEAPAAVSLVTSENITARTTLTATEHLKGLPSVDVASTGLNQSNVVVRGFNNIFSGSMLVLTDYRIARVPSLRFNAHNFIPIVNSDIDRIEVVSGPGSALYGPNSANGVMHILTKSPFGSEGTIVSFGGGERDLLLGSVRHAGSYDNRIGYKFSWQGYQGNDWEHHESEEQKKPIIQKFRPTADGPVFVGDSIPNIRNFDIKKNSFTGRIDYLFNKDVSLIANGGYNKSSSIELTGLGAGQAIDWAYYFGQLRLTYKDLWVQGFVNGSDAGETFLLNTGQLVVDKSKFWAVQAQHRYNASKKLDLTYGVDVMLTRPNTESTINGRNENDDNINEFGGYAQGDFQATDKLKFVGAARLDSHSELEDLNFSPRAAFVYALDQNNNFRATYNRAFSTPDNNNLYLDILHTIDPFQLGPKMEPILGFNPGIDIRVQGVPESGFHWNMGAEGPQFRSTFAPLDTIRGLNSSDLINFNDPIFTNVMWSVGRGAVLTGLSQQLFAAYDSATAGALFSVVNGVVPTTVTTTENTLMAFNLNSKSFDRTSIADIADIDRMKPTTTQTFELGYKGVLFDRLRFSVDLYRTQKENFVGPLTVETPNVFLDPATLGGDLTTQIQAAYDAATPGQRAALDNFDADSSGSPVNDLVTMFTTGAAGIPFGTVTPNESTNPDAILVTYRNFGDISFYGADLAFSYHLHRKVNVGGAYSYVSKNFFEKSAEQVHDINLNAPKHKFSLNAQYTHDHWGLTADTRLRFVDSFDMDSPFDGTTVESYTIVDLNLGINLMSNTRLAVTVQNVADNMHTEFIGGAEMGRVTIARITQSF